MKSKYNDSDPLYTIERGYNESTRFLMFHSTPIEVDKLKEALEIIGDYNDFNGTRVANELIKEFGDTCKYVVGREYSVVVYVLPKADTSLTFGARIDDFKKMAKLALADECDFDTQGGLRLWWD